MGQFNLSILGCIYVANPRLYFRLLPISEIEFVEIGCGSRHARTTETALHGWEICLHFEAASLNSPSNLA